MRTKQVLEFYKGVYLCSLLVCVSFLIISTIHNPDYYIISVLQLFDFGFLEVLEGGDSTDLTNLANLLCVILK